MRRSLLSHSLIERLKLFSVLSSTTNKYGTPRANPKAMQEVIKALEIKVKEKPKEWIFWYVLGDLHSAIGDYAKAVYACEKCYELRPRDPRSAYALATTLRMLTRAKYVNHPKVVEIQEFIAKSGMSGYGEFDPLKSQQGLEELNLTIDQAAEKSLTLFEEVISLGVRESESKMVHDNLAAMYTEFPYLEAKVKSHRKPSTGLFAEARDDPFNQATDHYRKLRYVMNDPIKFQIELLETVRLCQLSIAKQKTNGDAYVLLANAYNLAALHARSEGHDYCLHRAAAVIHEWRTNQPPTKNREIGERLYQEIIEELQHPLFNRMNASTQMSVDNLHKQYYQEAINPDTIANLKLILTDL